MRLESMTIQNFRGYQEEQTITFRDLTTFVGKNDVGKSTLLEALSIFFGDGVAKPDATDFNVFTHSDTFEIGCTFSNLPDEIVIDANAKTDLGSEFLLNENGMLTVKKRWTKGAAKPKETVFIICEHPTAAGFDNLLAQKNKDLKTLLNKILSPEEIKEKEIRLNNNVEMRQAIWKTCKNLEPKTTEISVLSEDSKKIWENLSKHLPHFALFQADRPSQDSDNEVQDPMKLAISTALAEPEIMDLLQKVEKAVEDKATELATRTHQSLKELSPDVGEGLTPQFKTPPKWANQFGISLESDHGISINKRGSGIRRLVLVSFFRAEAQRRMEENSKNNVIYAIEEPETAQHPGNQKILLESFKQMSELEECQVILTTHSPSVAGALPSKTLRFIKKIKNIPTVQESEDMLGEIAEELGIFPDNRVKVLICVEGPTDVSALKALSKSLHSHDSSIIDLSSDPRFAFVPMGGGTLKQWVSEHYLKHLELPEFHLYDNDVDDYQESAREVNLRSNCKAMLTERRAIENYIHQETVQTVFGVEVDFTEVDEVPKIISAETKKDAGVRSWNKENVKRKIASECFPLMTPSHIQQIGAKEEITSWLSHIASLAE